MKHWLLSIAGLLLLAGCEAAATPVVAVVQPTNTAEIIATLPPPIRYGLAANINGYLDERGLLEETALVEFLPAGGLLAGYDLIATYGLFDDWQQSPTAHHFALILNTHLAPLDNPTIAQLIRRSVNTQALVNATGIDGAQAAIVEHLPSETIKTELANAGFPDGFQLTFAAMPVPATNNVINQLADSNLQTDRVEANADNISNMLSNNRAHLFLIRWVSEDEQQQWIQVVGEENFIALYTLPISYQADASLTITFTSQGWPLPAR